MSARIVILTGNHACHNPRVLKEAQTLADAGFDVEWLGGWYDDELAQRDKTLITKRKWRFIPVVDWTGDRARLRKNWQRLRRLWGLKRFEWASWENDGQLGYCTRELLAVAKQRDAHLYIAHAEPAMWVAEQLRLQGRRIGIDMEDWFAEDLPPEARKHRPLKLMRGLERTLLRNAAHSSCPSQAMSEALANEYDCRPPKVVYNAFAWADRQFLDGQFKDRCNLHIPSIHWYSQTLGGGRGLEDLLAALPYVKYEAEIHLRGKLSSGFEQWLMSQVPSEWRHRIFIHELVSNDELLSRIAEHDIGFAGEMKYCRSRDLTVTNKILHYFLAGLGVIASDTTGQLEVAEQAPEAVQIYLSGDPSSLAECLNEWLWKPGKLADAKVAALQAAQEKFCWEVHKTHLLNSVEEALCSSNC
jgi:glycosyltransferase involved in cell wall biosynthesis